MLVHVFRDLPELFKGRSQAEGKGNDSELYLKFLSELQPVEVKAIESVLRAHVTAEELMNFSLTFLKVGKSAKLFKYVKAKISLRNWNEMKEKLSGGRVRVNQFAKTFRRVSSQMLFQAFLRGVAIYCMENQPVIDLCIPIFFPDETGVVKCSTMSCLVIKIKLQEHFESENFKLNWLQDVLELSICANASAVKPFVSVFCEFGKPEALGGPSQKGPDVRAIRQGFFEPSHKRQADGSRVRLVQTPFHFSAPVKGYAVFIRGLSVGDLSIWGVDSEDSVLKAFKRLLSASTDPAESPDVNPEVHAHIKQMFNSIAYNECPPMKKKK
jgi:hypothetical protein